jgi:Zn finger protein HypA/HybF involved in hydrogenase expression
MKVEYIHCESCGKTIQKRNNRVLCIACSNKRDKEISKVYREIHRDEIRYKNRERARLKREAIKRDE